MASAVNGSSRVLSFFVVSKVLVFEDHARRTRSRPRSRSMSRQGSATISPTRRPVRMATSKFVDRDNDDMHLSVGSPAVGAGPSWPSSAATSTRSALPIRRAWARSSMSPSSSPHRANSLTTAR